MLAVASFRDPGGRCFTWGNRILRTVNSSALAEIEPFLATSTAAQLVARQQLISTRQLSAGDLDELRQAKGFDEFVPEHGIGAVFEHERVEFPSYPYEWPPEMLYAAGMLTLDLAQACLADGYSLKDATPNNVLFRGSKPVFIDVLSFDRRAPGDPIWKPNAQFCRTFLLPLLAYKYWGIRPADVFAKRRDGLEPNDVYGSVGRYGSSCHLSSRRFPCRPGSRAKMAREPSIATTSSRITSRHDSSWNRCLTGSVDHSNGRSPNRADTPSGRITKILAVTPRRISPPRSNLSAPRWPSSNRLGFWISVAIPVISATWRPVPAQRSWRLTAISLVSARSGGRRGIKTGMYFHWSWTCVVRARPKAGAIGNAPASWNGPQARSIRC